MRPTVPVQRPNPPGSLAPQMPQQTPPTQSPVGVPTPAATVGQPAVQPGPMGPPVAPVVTYRDGLLSVQALNSNLSSVVTAIRNKTGIEFEGAEGISERVAIALGPAPEGDVLAAIFAGSKYDFLAIGRADSPTIVQKVIRRTSSRRRQSSYYRSYSRCGSKKVRRRIQPTIRIRLRGKRRRDKNSRSLGKSKACCCLSKEMICQKVVTGKWNMWLAAYYRLGQ